MVDIDNIKENDYSTWLFYRIYLLIHTSYRIVVFVHRNMLNSHVITYAFYHIFSTGFDTTPRSLQKVEKQSLTIRNSNGANHLTRKIRWTTSTIIILLSTLHYTQNIYLIFQTSTFQRPTKSNLSQQSPQKPTTTTNSNKIYNNINHHRYT